jgi:hypothetical protein
MGRGTLALAGSLDLGSWSLGVETPPSSILDTWALGWQAKRLRVGTWTLAAQLRNVATLRLKTPVKGVEPTFVSPGAI